MTQCRTGLFLLFIVLGSLVIGINQYRTEEALKALRALVDSPVATVQSEQIILHLLKLNDSYLEAGSKLLKENMQLHQALQTYRQKLKDSGIESSDRST